MNLCDYGCGLEAKYTMKNGKYCCSQSPNSCNSNKHKNSLGVKNSNLTGKRKSQKQIYIDLSQDKKDLMNWSKNKIINKFEDIFCINNFSSGYVKKALLLLGIREYKCEICSISEWNEKSIILELDHINGDRKNNNLDNIRLLCPNCHSQTNTFRGKNINTGKIKVTDIDLLNAINTTNSIRQALIKVDLAPKGGNYTRVKNLKDKYFENN